MWPELDHDQILSSRPANATDAPGYQDARADAAALERDRAASAERPVADVDG